MSVRGYFGYSIIELENLAEAVCWRDAAILRRIVFELEYRCTKRSAYLKQQIERQLLILSRAGPENPPETPPLDRSKIVEIGDVVVLSDGRRLQVCSVVTDRVGDAYHIKRYEALAQRLLEASLGDEITLLNGAVRRIISIEKRRRPDDRPEPTARTVTGLKSLARPAHRV